MCGEFRLCFIATILAIFINIYFFKSGKEVLRQFLEGLEASDFQTNKEGEEGPIGGGGDDKEEGGGVEGAVVSSNAPTLLEKLTSMISCLESFSAREEFTHLLEEAQVRCCVCVCASVLCMCMCMHTRMRVVHACAHL